MIHRIVAKKRCAKLEGKGESTIKLKVKNNPLQSTSTEVAHQTMSLKEPEHMLSIAKKPSENQILGPRDQLSPYIIETMQSDDQPIYEETF